MQREGHLGNTQRLLFHNSDTWLLGLGLKDPGLSFQRTGDKFPHQLPDSPARWTVPRVIHCSLPQAPSATLSAPPLSHITVYSLGLHFSLLASCGLDSWLSQCCAHRPESPPPHLNDSLVPPWFLLPSEYKGFPRTSCEVLPLQNLSFRELTYLTLPGFQPPIIR